MMATAIGKWRRYSEYRPSGVEWLGEIPVGWTTIPVKRRYAVQLGKMLQNSPGSDADVSIPYIKALHVQWGKVDTSDLPEMWASSADIGQFEIKSGDLLVCEGGEAGRAGIVNYAPNPCIIQNALHRVRDKGADVRYLQYVLHMVGSGGWFEVLCNKATIAHFTREKLTELRIPLPPKIDIQHAIAAFLDRETTRIDALISKKERQIELLQEKRTALISHVVTKGINPDVKMKPSDIEWLGEIPEHWKINRAKILFKEINERSVSGEEELLTVSHITGVTRRSEKNVNMFFAESMEGYKICKSKDLVINTMWAWMGAMGIAFEPGIVSPSYNVYRFRSSANEPRFYDYLFRTGRFVSEVIRHSKGVWASRLRLYPEEFLEIRLPCPPPHEQRDIVEAIERETGKYNELQQLIESSIIKLREYRTALISAAVTGKIDVCDQKNVMLKINPAFRRAVLAAEIVSRMHGEQTFGRVKFQKMLYFCEHHLGMDLDGKFQRQAAGPFDNRMLRSVESQMKQQNWYAAQKVGQRTAYVPLKNPGEHLKYFNNYWSPYRERLDSLIDLLRPLDTERCEIVATLFAAWNDLIISRRPFNDVDIIREVRANWHESKKRFDENRLRKALQWMRDKGLVPKGYGKVTMHTTKQSNN